MAKSFLSGKNGKKKSSGKTLPWKKVALVAGTIVVAFGLGVGAFLLQHGMPEPTENRQPNDTQVPENQQKPQGAIEESSALLFEGKYDKAQQKLEKEIAETENTQRKQRLLIQQASYAYNEKKYAQSLAYAREALELADNYQANMMAASAAEAAGELEAAEGYYRRMLELLQQGERRYPDEEQRIKESIQRVSQ